MSNITVTGGLFRWQGGTLTWRGAVRIGTHEVYVVQTSDSYGFSSAYDFQEYVEKRFAERLAEVLAE